MDTKKLKAKYFSLLEQGFIESSKLNDLALEAVQSGGALSDPRVVEQSAKLEKINVQIMKLRETLGISGDELAWALVSAEDEDSD